MSEKSVARNALKICMEDSVQKVFEILEKEDGRTFEEKRKEVAEYLKDKENSVLEERILKTASDDEIGRRYKEQFWKFGENILVKKNFVLRKVNETDKEFYISLQKETSLVKFMLKEEAYRNLIWKEHTQYKSLICTIVIDDEYVGYCGINNTASEKWEISIELMSKWRGRGIGYDSLNVMLREIKRRLEVKEFYVKIDPENYASQRLFEKLGAVPESISEFMLYDEEDKRRCEEENLHLLDDRLNEVAEKFGVEPRKLLSHVLEYKLEW